MTKRNLKRDSTLPNNVWDALLHELDNNWSLFPHKPLLYLGTVTPRSLSLSVTASVTSQQWTRTWDMHSAWTKGYWFRRDKINSIINEMIDLIFAKDDGLGCTDKT